MCGHAPNPVARLSSTARICVCGQAPGTRVHRTQIPFNDRSGARLRDWLDISESDFYDPRRVAIAPMAFCFPGQDAHGGDLPPPAQCAQHWRARLFAAMPQIELLLLIGQHAQRWHLGNQDRKSVTLNVAAWRDFLPEGKIPLPHPSWRNNGWLKRNAWFEEELVPVLRKQVHALL